MVSAYLRRGMAAGLLAGLSLLTVLLAWLAARSLKTRSLEALRRRLTLFVGVPYLLLRAAPSAGGFPSGVLWAFKLSSFGTQVVFWAGLGLLFGWHCERTRRKGVTA